MKVHNLMNNVNRNPIRVRRIFALVMLMIGLPLILDQTLFRGIYLSVLEPESTAGMTLLARSTQGANYAPGKRNILIIGDSRIGEGFSAKIANEIGNPQGFNFIGLGLPGTTPRTWHYVLRDLDAHRDKYQAIFMMSATLRDDDIYEDFANRSIDTAYLAPLLRWGDFYSYPQSFTEPKETLKASIAVAFPAVSLHSDFIAFLKAPIRRLRKASQWRADYPSWIAAYPGHAETMPPVEIPFTPESVLARLNDASRRQLDEYFRLYQHGKPEPQARTFAYRSKWFGQIAEQYSATAVTIGTFLIPRGPYHAELKKPAEAQGSLKLLERKGVLSLLGTEVSLPLEKPEFFFDHLHMNAVGRDAFSRNLAKSVIAQLEH